MNTHCIYCPKSSPPSSNDSSIISLGSHLSPLSIHVIWVQLTPTHGTMSVQLGISLFEHSDSLRVGLTQDGQWLNGETFPGTFGKKTLSAGDESVRIYAWDF